MKMAKASKVDIKALQDFFNNLEEAIEERKSDKVIAAYVRACLRGRVGSAHNRVTIGCDVLIDNVCDPEKSYLDYKSELKQLMPETENEQGEKLFYVISYQYSESGIIKFWGANNAGYTSNIKCAGKYPESKIRSQMDYYHQGDCAIAVPVAEIHNGTYKIVENVWIDYNQKPNHFERVKLGILTDAEKEVSIEKAQDS